MIYCLYHKNCRDGFAAAWAVWTLHENATFIPVQYGDPLPDMPDADKIYIVDFSYKRDILMGLENVVVIDHHKSAEKDCEGFIFDLNHSGAYLAWDHLWGYIPEIVKYVEDRDLWKWALPNSREINAAIELLELDFNIWRETDIEGLLEQGKIILKYQKTLLERIIKNAQMIVFEGREIALINTGLFQSELGDYFDTVASYYIKEGEYYYSLRSKSIDVSLIAQRFGGGGHVAAAGFKSKNQVFL